MTKYVCEFCGKKFERSLTEIKKAKKHYCSRQCRFEAQKQTNDFFVCGDYVKVICEYKNEYLMVYLDNEDWQKCQELGYKITIQKKPKDTTYYAKIHNYSLHRFITNCPKNKIVDHINHNGLDNRKSNLRICTYTENNRNRITKSGHRGVYWAKKLNKWKVELEADGITYYGGYFVDFAEAIKARKKLEAKYW